MPEPPNELTELDRQAFRLLWSGQGGLVEFTEDRERKKRMLVPIDEALDRMAEFNYFGVVPRSGAAAGYGKQSVCPEVWSVWVDIDSRDGADLLRSLGSLEPTFILHSGRGYWGHWKLAAPVTQSEAESLMRGLIVHIGGDEVDTACWNVDRTARLPGSVNEKTDKTAHVIEIQGHIFAPQDMRDKVPLIYTPAGRESHSIPANPTQVLPRSLSNAAAAIHPIDLPDDLWIYCLDRPTWKQAHSASPEVNRSAREYAIAKELLRRGFSDEDVMAWFDHHRLPRHRQELAKQKTPMWTENLIAKARAALVIERDIDAESPPSPLSIDRTLHQHPTRAYSQVDRKKMIALVAQHEPISYTNLCWNIQESMSCSSRAAKQNISLARKEGWIENPSGHYVLTDASRRQLELAAEQLPRGSEGMKWATFTGKQPGKYIRQLEEARAAVLSASGSKNHQGM